MKKSIRYLIIGLLIATLVLTSIVFFRDISESILVPKTSEYNINIVNSPTAGWSDEDWKNSGLVIGLDIDAIGQEDVDIQKVVPVVTEGDDGNYYLAGIKTDIAATVDPSMVHVNIGNSKDEQGQDIKTWYIDGVDSNVVVKENYDLSDISVEVDPSDNTYIIAGRKTKISAKPGRPTIEIGENETYLINGEDSLVEKISLTYVMDLESMEGVGYGIGFSTFGDSLISDQNKLLSKFRLLTEVLESSQDYYVGGDHESKDEHFANKYYLMNTSDDVRYLIIHFKAKGVKGALDAARFMIAFKDPETAKYVYTVYAKQAKDGSREFVAVDNYNKEASQYRYLMDLNEIDYDADTYLTTDVNKAWRATSLTYNSEYEYFEAYSSYQDEDGKYSTGVIAIEPGSTISYTFSAWFEASDAEHNDQIKDGSISFQIDYELIDPKNVK